MTSLLTHDQESHIRFLILSAEEVAPRLISSHLITVSDRNYTAHVRVALPPRRNTILSINMSSNRGLPSAHRDESDTRETLLDAIGRAPGALIRARAARILWRRNKGPGEEIDRVELHTSIHTSA